MPSEAQNSERALEALNLALIVGDLVAPAERRVMPTGSELASFSLTVRCPNEATTSVPLVWFDPPKRVWRWKPGATVVARGPVVRRFYQAGGATASRTEVSVRSAEVATQPKRVAGVINQVEAAIRAIADSVTG